MGRKFTLKCHIVFCVKYRKKLLAKANISQTIKDTILSSQTDEFQNTSNRSRQRSHPSISRLHTNCVYFTDSAVVEANNYSKSMVFT